MRMLMLLTGLASRLLGLGREPSKPGRETESDRRLAEALAAVRDANEAMAIASADTAKSMVAFGDEASKAMMTTLGGCYHDAVAYSLAYEAAGGDTELCGETFTSLDTGIDGGAKAALRRHMQNFDPARDVPRFIVALRPVKVIGWRSNYDTEAYGLPPGPMAGDPPTASVWGEHVAKGRFNVVKRAVDMVKQDCERRGIDISKSMVTVSVTPHDGQEAFARCEPAKACDECSCPSCECDGGCDKDYATSCHMCDTWLCSYCVVEGACNNCFAKMQGGVI